MVMGVCLCQFCLNMSSRGHLFVLSWPGYDVLFRSDVR